MPCRSQASFSSGQQPNSLPPRRFTTVLMPFFAAQAMSRARGCAERHSLLLT
jgi:hypothetical protein